MVKELNEKNFAVSAHYHYYYKKEYSNGKPAIKDKRKTIAGIQVTQDLDPESVFGRASRLINSVLSMKR